MFTRSSKSLLVGSLLLAPMMIVAGCEDFEQQGEMGEEEPGMVEEEQAREPGTEPETREQRREAEREFGERPETERPEAEQPETEQPGAEQPERPDEPRAGEEAGESARAMMAMTEMQVELPEGIQAGSYDLQCPLQEGQQAQQQQQTQQQQQQAGQEQQVVQLHITVEETGEQRGGITGQN